MEQENHNPSQQDNATEQPKKRAGRPKGWRKYPQKTDMENNNEEEVVKGNASDNIPDEPVNNVSAENVDYDPLTTEPVAEKIYAKPFAPTDPTKPIADIPEAKFTPPSFNAQSEQQTTKPQEPSFTETPFNSKLNDLPPAEKKRSAETLADAIVGAYDLIHKGARWFVKVSDDKLNKMYAEGSLSPDLAIPLNPEGTRHMTLADFIRDFNNQVDDSIAVSSEFKEQVRPVLIRVLAKYNFGMTDEQMLMYLVGQDVVTKGAMVFALKKQMTSILNNFKDGYKAVIEANRPKATTQASPQPQQDQNNEPKDVDFEILEREER